MAAHRARSQPTGAPRLPPKFESPNPSRDALAREATYSFALDENPAARPLNLAAARHSRSAGHRRDLIGPEGGWTDEERAQFTAAEWTPVSLGPLILRAETAALAALAIVNSAWCSTSSCYTRNLVNRLVFENLKHRPLRTLLGIVSIGVEVTMILTLVGVSHGVTDDMALRTRGTGADIVVRPPNSNLFSLRGVGMPEKIVGVIREEPHVAHRHRHADAAGRRPVSTPSPEFIWTNSTP